MAALQVPSTLRRAVLSPPAVTNPNGIAAQSIGGGGGNGGFSVGGAISGGAPGLAFSLGGAGGTGAEANNVVVAESSGSISTEGAKCKRHSRAVDRRRRR